MIFSSIWVVPQDIQVLSHRNMRTGLFLLERKNKHRYFAPQNSQDETRQERRNKTRLEKERVL